MNKEIKGKYPIQFWISEELKKKADVLKDKLRISHKEIYEKGLESFK